MKINITEPQDDGYQDIDVNIEPWDTWALDYTLALITIPALEQLRDTMHSWPKNHFETFEEWVEALNKMIDSFENVIHDENTGIEYWTDERWDDAQEGFALFGKHYLDLWH